MIIDTHCHLNFYQFKDSWQKLIKKCLKNNFWLINIGCNLNSSKKAVEMASKFEKGVFAAVGIHPTDSKENFEEKLFLNLLENEKVVAIGEIGLDYWHLPFDKNKQYDTLNGFLDLAVKVKKPVVFHARNSKDKEKNAYKDLLVILENYNTIEGVIHSFEGTIEEAEEFIKKGFFLGFNGLITRSKKSAKVAKKVPLKKIVLETDSPYLLPFGAEGKINTPCNTIYVAQKIAKLKNISLKEVENITTKNAKEVFRI